MIGRLRLVDAVVVATVTLLGIKGLDYALRPAQPAPTALASASSVVPGGDLPAFARVIAQARTNYTPPDVVSTGATPDRPAAPAAAAPAGDPRTAPPRPSEAAPSGNSPAERALLERLGERREELQQRARDLDMRERLLENAEKKIEGRINELKGMEGRGEAPGAAKPEADPAMRNLVLMYETMKPKDAARVFDRLAHDVLVPVVMQMNPRKMAEVLAVMSPEAAEKLTVALAQRARGPAPAQAAQAPAPLNELPAIDAPRR